MKVDRKKCENIFAAYTEHYNAADPKIKLKIDHTYRVAALSERIARSLKLSGEQVDLAWLIGLLHDIGRFEQIRRYGTFSDAKSIDHARFGVALLYGEDAKSLTDTGLLEQYVPEDCTDRERMLIRKVIENHSAYRIETGLDPEMEQFCHIIRDADKIDILRVSYETGIEAIYDVTTEQLLQDTVTEEVMQAFSEKHAVLRKYKKTSVDHIVGHISLVFELVYPESNLAVQEQGYLDKLLAFSSKNPMTQKQFMQLRKIVQEYFSGRHFS